MILWINGAFGSGKTSAAFELNRRLPRSFVYDPENVGYFIRRNTNGLFSDEDFQDIPLWREMNYKILRMIAEEYDGTVIVPMTLVNPVYYNEIVERLISDGIEIKHYILYVSPDEIKRRLRKRSFGIRNEDFAIDAINRCVNSFDNHITDVKIHTDKMSIDEVVEKIAELAGLQLATGRLTGIKKLIFRAKVYCRHM